MAVGASNHGSFINGDSQVVLSPETGLLAGASELENNLSEPTEQFSLKVCAVRRPLSGERCATIGPAPGSDTGDFALAAEVAHEP
eukprot:CAMPEP_0181215470 /NCGR_PEP_ID=MMETSP1096-20121128/26033_1 /TAXON_ID=156174 ORGANISM="Chrysochromulina ericina, Strain CCMP281" /NCGR_SAMPLE_ID=MMETSP1096 /ASSEMBLY_ACC=CAM_ASM_000453 /LENGTH=84 /DNA_ID=CAMNT_0023307333 /DNA_START=464 /DNA_END=714 /DNA_ORIENTATION=+